MRWVPHHVLSSKTFVFTSIVAVLMLAVVGVVGLSPAQKNMFGIGAYYPPGIEQISTARDLVGAGGWVLILVPAGECHACGCSYSVIVQCL